MNGADLISANDIAEATGKAVRTIQRIAVKDGWPHKIINNRGDRLFYIDGLPPGIREMIARRRYGIDGGSAEDMAAAFNMKIPPEKLKDPAVASKVRMVCECLAVPEGARGRKKRIKNIAESHGYNTGTAYRLIKRAKDGKSIVKATKNHGVVLESLGITLRAWDREAAHMAVETIIGNKRNHAEKLTLYERIKDRAEADNLKVGSYRAFLDLYARVSDSVLTFRDKGARGLREEIVPAIRRDHTAYRVMECLIGDQHKADYYCFDYNGDVATLELFCWLDFRTQMAWGAISYRHYNRYTVGQALINAVGWGLPSQVYTDWGKPEESNYVTSLLEQITGLGIKTDAIRHTRAKVRHPQAKPIEAWFGWLDRNLRNDGMPGYCKRLRDGRENEMQQKDLKRLINEGGLLPIDEMADRILSVIERWNDHAFKNRAPDNGKSPRELYRIETAKHPVATLSEDLLEYIFLPVQDRNGNGKPLMVKRSQVKIKHEIFNRTLTYYAPDLADVTGAEVSVRYNPFDPDRVWVFDRSSGKLLCCAEQWNMINPKNRDQVSARIEIQNRLVKQVRDKYRVWLPEKSNKTHIPRIHPQEREARAYKAQRPKRRGGDLRICRTPLDDLVDEETGDVLQAEASAAGRGRGAGSGAGIFSRMYGMDSNRTRRPERSKFEFIRLNIDDPGPVDD